jgi:hypothetical protein
LPIIGRAFYAKKDGLSEAREARKADSGKKKEKEALKRKRIDADKNHGEL